MRGKAWDGEAEKILMREYQRRSAEEIAAMIGCSTRTIVRRLGERGFKPINPALRNLTRRQQLLSSAAGIDVVRRDEDWS